MRLTTAAVLLLAISSAPALAQNASETSTLPNLLSSQDPALKLQRRGFSFPVVEYAEPTGARKQRKGIIAGQQIARGTILGIGFFETAPKARSFSPEPDPRARPKKSRQAAVGLSWRF